MNKLTEMVKQGIISVQDILDAQKVAQIVHDAPELIKNVVRFHVGDEEYCCYVNEHGSGDLRGVYIHVKHNGEIYMKITYYGNPYASIDFDINQQTGKWFAKLMEFDGGKVDGNFEIKKEEIEHIHWTWYWFVEELKKLYEKGKYTFTQIDDGWLKRWYNTKRKKCKRESIDEKFRYISEEDYKPMYRDAERRKLIEDALIGSEKTLYFKMNEDEIPCKIRKRQWATITFDGILKVPTKTGEVVELDFTDPTKLYEAIDNPEFGHDLEIFLVILADKV